MLSKVEFSFLETCKYELRERTSGTHPLDLAVTEDNPIDRNRPEVLASYLAWDSLSMITMGCADTVRPPRTALAKMTLRAARRWDLVPPIDDDIPSGEDFDHPLDALACFEAETRFAHSLAKQKQRQEEPRPASILLGADGRPIAYQKGNGKPIAMTVRDGYIQTADGPKWAPKDALLWLQYETGYRPQDIFVDKPLLAFANPRIRTAHFLRFTLASWAPKGIALEVLQQASGRAAAEVSEADIAAGATLSAKRLGRRLRPLMKKAFRVV